MVAPLAVAILTALFLLAAITGWIDSGRVPRLEPADALDPPAVPPGVAAVFAARDEGPEVEETVRRLLAQEGVSLRVIVVDDRSGDEFAARLRALAAAEPRVTTIRIEALPDGWLGKCHALQRGARDVDEEWILFGDADSWLEPTVVSRAVGVAVNERAQHVCLIPADRSMTFAGRAAFLSLLASFLKNAAAANRDRRLFGFVGVGAFNLVRRDAYRTIGGHRPLRLEVLDDAMLGMLLRRAGFRSRCRVGYPEVTVRWASRVREFPRALRKNAFAMTGYRTWVTVAGVVAALALYGGTWTAPLWAGPAGWAPVAAWAAGAVPSWRVARRFGWQASTAALAPLLQPLPAWILLRSTIGVLKDGGVRWRDTLYPLDRLRRSGVPMISLGARPARRDD